MPPVPARIHQKVVIALAARIHRVIEGTDCEVYAAPFDVRLPDRDEADEVVTTVVHMDISVICDPAKLDDKGCRGIPDWIIEVLSPATAAKDQIQKRALYERHGVREYRLVHPVDRILFIYQLGADGCGKPQVLPTSGRCDPVAVPGLNYRLGPYLYPHGGDLLAAIEGTSRGP